MPSVTRPPVSSAVRMALFSTPRNNAGWRTTWSDGSTIIIASPYFFRIVTAPQPIHGAVFFAAQSHCGVAEVNGQVVGLYILHPNNVGRCGHIANASYAVDARCRGHHVGEQLVQDSLAQAKEMGFRILQFNAVVESNRAARHLYERLGFVPLGTIPGGFRLKNGQYENICPYYRVL